MYPGGGREGKGHLDPATSGTFRLGKSFVLALARCLAFALTLTFFALVFAWPVLMNYPVFPQVPADTAQQIAKPKTLVTWLKAQNSIRDEISIPVLSGPPCAENADDYMRVQLSQNRLSFLQKMLNRDTTCIAKLLDKCSRER